MILKRNSGVILIFRVQSMSLIWSLEKAGRIADYFELAVLLVTDALNREESCGAHFREEYQTPDGEALRNDKSLLMLLPGNIPEKINLIYFIKKNLNLKRWR